MYDLHSASSNLTKLTALDEKGQIVNGRTEKPNKHDILTGSRPDGTAFPDASWAVSWNSAHPTLGCSMEKIRPTGGDGLFYCFAVK